MAWTVVLLDEVEDWYLDLVRKKDTALQPVTAAIDLLEEHSPALGRPTADHIKGSTRHNMKELRPGGTNIRVLYVFDPARKAVLLVAGDKTGDWSRWYKVNIPIAEERYRRWLDGDYDEEME